MSHATVPVKLKAGVCEIDTKIVELVKVVDGIDGIRTEFSCQGDDVTDFSEDECHSLIADRGQLIFGPDGESQKRCDLFVMRMVFLALRTKKDGCFLFTLDICGEKTFVIRWYQYEFVLSAAMETARRMQR